MSPSIRLQLQLFPFSSTKSAPSRKKPSKVRHEPSPAPSPGDGTREPAAICRCTALIAKPSPPFREDSQIQGNIPKQGHLQPSWQPPPRSSAPSTAWEFCILVFRHPEAGRAPTPTALAPISKANSPELLFPSRDAVTAG